MTQINKILRNTSLLCNKKLRKKSNTEMMESRKRNTKEFYLQKGFLFFNKNIEYWKLNLVFRYSLLLDLNTQRWCCFIYINKRWFDHSIKMIHPYSRFRFAIHWNLAFKSKWNYECVNSIHTLYILSSTLSRFSPFLVPKANNFLISKWHCFKNITESYIEG